VPAGLLAGVVGSLGVALLIGRFAHPNLASIIGALRGAALAGTAFVLLAGAIALAIARGRPERVIVASLAAGLAIALLVTASIGALREGRRQERPLAAKLRALAQDERLLFYFRAHGALLWYVGGDGARTTPNQPSHLLRLLPEADDRALVACGSSRCWDGDLAPQLACEPVLEAVAPPLGEWIAADPQYRVFRCVRRDPPG
jgi:hypothetical protein